MPGRPAPKFAAFGRPARFNKSRRTKVHKLLSGFGTWTQFSLFECWLTAKELVVLRQKLDKHLSAAKDRVRFYYLCEGCLKKVETVGMQLPHEDTLYLV